MIIAGRIEELLKGAKEARDRERNEQRPELPLVSLKVIYSFSPDAQ